MLNKTNTSLGLIVLKNLIEFFVYSDTQDDELFQTGIKKVIDIYKYMNNIYTRSLQKMEMKESKQIVLELETILSKISKLIDAIKTDADTTLIEELRFERNNLIEIKTKLLQEELDKINSKNKKGGQK
ncbi:Putative cytosolic protein (plasmid) [Borrelia crocidurae DOU]|uniref:Putative cytosolic protein n=1 Tax=Borrelia crocidurae DOU TaxID=1293575 RepID=W5SJN8_9SPIR|nr:BlyB family putative holin accessory protein [Borrelia crocidurae]AHH07339.1 Putative cytosolic protein [Borrelia crocidurae DOU]